MRALVLISGGLDSTLAARIIQNQGIEITALYCEIPFCAPPKEQLASLRMGIKYIDIKEKFLQILISPRYGFGSNINPCIDCKILMLEQAKALMPKLGADFIVTGEVLGQRPMSQNRQALELIEKKAGLESLILRPLSAKLLAETLPEKKGWVKRKQLLGFSGRSRKPQIALAKSFNIREYAQPAGGCLLTDPEFTRRLKELIAHQELSTDNIELLKIGRHFRLGPNTKLVVGRNEKENKKLVNLAKAGDYLFCPDEKLAGPTSLGRGALSEELIKLSCAITCRYCDLSGTTDADIEYRKVLKVGTVPAGGCPYLLNISPLAEDSLESLRI